MCQKSADFNIAPIRIHFHRYVIFLYLKFWSSVGTLTGLQAGHFRNLGSIAGAGIKLILSPNCPSRSCGPVSFLFVEYWQTLPEMKGPGESPLTPTLRGCYERMGLYLHPPCRTHWLMYWTLMFKTHNQPLFNVCWYICLKTMLSKYLFYYCDEQCLLFEGDLISMTYRNLVLFLSSRDLCHCADCLIGLRVEVAAMCIESGMFSKFYTTNRTLGTNSCPEVILVSMKICLYKFRRLKNGFVSKCEYRSRRYMCR